MSYIWIMTIPTSELSKRELLFRLRRRCHGRRWQFGIEVGANTGYEHYQVRYECSNDDVTEERRYWSDIRCNLLKAGGWSEYERKDGNFFSWMDDEMGKYRFAKLKNLQLCILAHGRGQGDRRITYVADHIGGTGKTFLARWSALNDKAIYIDGTDTRNINRNCFDALKARNFSGIRTIIIDLSRADKVDADLLRGIETLKNGYLSDGRYNYESVWISPPTLYVFANFDAPLDGLSKDRWDKIYLNKKDKYIEMWDTYVDQQTKERKSRRRLFKP